MIIDNKRVIFIFFVLIIVEMAIYFFLSNLEKTTLFFIMSAVVLMLLLFFALFQNNKIEWPGKNRSDKNLYPKNGYASTIVIDEDKNIISADNSFYKIVGHEESELSEYSIKIVKAKDKDKEISKIDVLTALPNRQALRGRLRNEFARSKRHKFYSAFIFIDLDNFKNINDSFGHQVGDRLLIEFSGRIKQVIRAEDYLSRISGDEFGLILVDLGDDKNSAALKIDNICSKIIKTLEEPYDIDGCKIASTASMGIAIFPNGVNDIESIIRNSDMAMYKAKEMGKNKYVYYDESIDREIQKTKIFRKKVSHIIENDKLLFYFRQIFNKEGNAVISQIIPKVPGENMKMDDNMLSICSIADPQIINKFFIKTFSKVCNFIKRSPESDLEFMINIPNYKCFTKNTINEIINIATLEKCDTKRIVFNISEEFLITNYEYVYKGTEELRKYGFKISINNFGSKFAPVKCLDKIRLDYLYLNHELISARRTSLLKSIISVSHTYNVTTIASKVDDRQEYDYVRIIGADFLNGGYLQEIIDEDIFMKTVLDFS